MAKASKVEKQTVELEPNKLTQLRWLVIIMAILIAMLTFLVIAFAVANDSVRSDNDALMKRDFQATDSMLGFGCGALSASEAEDLLGGEVDSRVSVSPTHYFGLTVADHADLQVGATESCSHTLRANSQVYVSVELESFASKEAAKKSFQHILEHAQNNAVGQNSEGNEVIYSNNGYVMLAGDRMLTVAASNGRPSENQQFTKPIFETISAKIESGL